MQTEAEWWNEDAERVNKRCDAAVKAGVVVDTREGPPPALNEDGSLQQPSPKSENPSSPPA